VKKLFTLFYSLLFGIGLLSGYWASLYISLPEAQAGEEPQVTVEPALVPMANGQRSILLVIVDDLQLPEPELTSAWLVLYMPSGPGITLMPLFPSPTARDPGSDEAFFLSFGLDREDDQARLSRGFEDHLKSSQIQWSGYVILDRTAVEAAAASLHRSASLYNLSALPYRSLVNSTAAGEQHLLPQEERLNTLLGEANYYKKLCLEASRSESWLGEEALAEVAALIPDHLAVSFDLAGLEAELRLLRSFGRSFSCEIPTLGIPATGSFDTSK
jgi:hypothetical protein